MKTNEIILGDCIQEMKRMESNTVDLVFADPPFNIGMKYDYYQDNKSYKEYFEWSKSWIMECSRLLKQSGSIYIAIGDEFAAEINIILKRLGLHFRNWIIWYYTFGQNQRRKFNRSHTHILYYTKGRESYNVSYRKEELTLFDKHRGNGYGGKKKSTRKSVKK